MQKSNLDKSSFEGKEFYYGEIGGEIFTEKLVPEQGGRISGYSHRNEAGWKFENGLFSFLNADGQTSMSFGPSWQGVAQHMIRGVEPSGAPSRLVLVRKDKAVPAGVLSALSETLYSNFSPFNFVDEACVDDGYPHTNLQPEIVEAVVSVVKPAFWLEVGSMLGGSAIRAAKGIKSMRLPTGIVCIDPFCGDVNMWSWEREKKLGGEWQFLKLENGRPTIYDRFLANVTAAGQSDIILPITATSIVGLKLLRRLFLEGRIPALPDVIYLDSAHEPDETLLELRNSWQTLKTRGVLFGDDWGWSPVRNDVIKFAQNLPQNTGIIKRMKKKYPAFQSVDGVLLDEKTGQWLLAK